MPLYDGDLDNERDRPAAVERLKRLVADADALLVATPEYNHSVPGVLQNAIDWVSRPAGRSPLAGKVKGAIDTVRDKAEDALDSIKGKVDHRG